MSVWNSSDEKWMVAMAGVGGDNHYCGDTVEHPLAPYLQFKLLAPVDTAPINVVCRAAIDAMPWPFGPVGALVC